MELSASLPSHCLVFILFSPLRLQVCLVQNTVYFQFKARGGEEPHQRAQQVRVLSAKPQDSIPRTHTQDTRLPWLSSGPPYVHHGAHTQTHIYSLNLHRSSGSLSVILTVRDCEKWNRLSTLESLGNLKMILTLSGSSGDGSGGRHSNFLSFSSCKF